MILFKPKPFLKWAGGKTHLLPTIESQLPEIFSSDKPITYIEPFIGGGALMFHLLLKYSQIKKAIINDINSHLINTYCAIKYHPTELIILLNEIQDRYRSLQGFELQKKFFLDIRDKFNKGVDSQIEEAAYMIFLNRTCFNGLYRENSKGEFNVAFGKYVNPGISEPNLIMADSALLQKVEILHGDFSQIEEFVDSSTFVYFDPPYRPITSTGFTSYSKVKFNDEEQIRLKNFFSKMSGKGCNLLLSNSDNPAYEQGKTYLDILYKDFIINRVYARRSISRDPSKRGPVQELLIRNYSKLIGD